jgi:mannosyltransferase
MALVVLAVLGCAAGLVAGVRSGPLWLDEALSVEIARLPLSQLPEALRQDGAPPLYYLLLKAWMAVFGDGTIAVRLLSVVLVPVALVLVHRVGGLVTGRAGARAGVVVLAALPWTMRYGSEARMYALVVVLVLAGTLAVHAAHTSASHRPVAAVAVVGAALALTHYWALFLLAAVGLVHLPGVVRRHLPALRVTAGLLAAGLLFSPWVPTLLFQAVHTGAPWADPVTPVDLLRTARFWGGGRVDARTVFAVLVVPLAVVGALRVRLARRGAGVVLLTLVLAWTSAAVGTGTYTARYTAVVVPFVALLVGLGAVALGGRWRPLLALTAVTAAGLVFGVPAAAHARTSAGDVVAALRKAGSPGDLVVYCPDQLGPPVARELDGAYEQVVYPTLGPPERVDWVDYAARQQATDPSEVAGRVDSRAGGRAVLVLWSTQHRTFEGHCEALLDGLAQRRGRAEHVYGELERDGQVLVRFPAR